MKKLFWENQPKLHERVVYPLEFIFLGLSLIVIGIVLLDRYNKHHHEHYIYKKTDYTDYIQSQFQLFHSVLSHIWVIDIVDVSSSLR